MVGTHPVIRGKQIVISMNFGSLKHTSGISTLTPNHETTRLAVNMDKPLVGNWLER